MGAGGRAHPQSGPETVTDLGNTRPVSYVDELEGLFDAAWLATTRAHLEEAQAGGRFDAVLMTVGLLMALQLRVAAGMRTLVLRRTFGMGSTWHGATPCVSS